MFIIFGNKVLLSQKYKQIKIKLMLSLYKDRMSGDDAFYTWGSPAM